MMMMNVIICLQVYNAELFNARACTIAHAHPAPPTRTRRPSVLSDNRQRHNDHESKTVAYHAEVPFFNIAAWNNDNWQATAVWFTIYSAIFSTTR